MNAYNSLASAKRLENSGLPRSHAEAIANEITEGSSSLVTKDELLAALDRQTIKMSIVMAGMLTLACTVLGVLFTLSK